MLFLATSLTGTSANRADRPFLAEVNLAGAEFGGPRGLHGVDYVDPVKLFAPGYQSLDYFVSQGMNPFRLPFLWERLQPKLGEPLDAAEAARLVSATEQLLKLGVWVVQLPAL